MSGISSDNISIKGFDGLQRVLSVHVKAEVNQHAYMTVEGVLNSSKMNDLKFQNLEGRFIEFCKNDGPLLFTGLILTTSVNYMASFYYLTLQCVSTSYLFDQEKQKRCFQDTHMKYKDLLQIVAGPKRNIVSIAPGDRTIPNPIFQLEETDWELCKRIASHFHSVVIPSLVGEFPQIAVGIVSGRKFSIENEVEYQLHSSLSKYRKDRKYAANFLPLDYISYQITCLDNFNLGDKVTFKNRALIVLGKEMNLKDGLLTFTYLLGSEKLLGLQKLYNTNLVGLSLKGKVLHTHNEKIQLDFDIEQHGKDRYWFDFVPITGNILYCMPEPGAIASLYFPDQDEKRAMIVECHKPAGEYPHDQAKTLSTPYDKVQMASPGGIRFLANDGDRHHQISLIDSMGLALETSKRVNIAAKSKVAIRSKRSVAIRANSLIQVAQAQTVNFLDMSNEGIIYSADKYLSSSLPYPSWDVVRRAKALQPQVLAVNTVLSALGSMATGGNTLSSTAVAAVPSMNSPSHNINIKMQMGFRTAK